MPRGDVLKPSSQREFGVLRIAIIEEAYVDVQLAGLGRRMAAAAVDYVLIGLATAAALVAFADDILSPVAVGVTVALPVLGPLVFETVLRGRTPGKLLFGLRVVNLEASPPSFAQLFLRNMLRLVDFLPFGYVLGGVVAFGSKRGQRCGDLVASTVVITEEAPGAGVVPASAADQERIARFAALAQRGEARRALLDDAEVVTLVREYRWAAALLATGVRSPILQRALLQAHGVIYIGSPQSWAPLGQALRTTGRSFALAWLVFFATLLGCGAAVLYEPMLAYSLLPRELLAQIDAETWGPRGSVAADLGMTFFYWGNNLRASFLALALGLLGGFPALIAIAINGALFGTVAAVALSRGAVTGLLGWIGPHAVPELTALMLCGAIGLELGRSWLYPGALPRAAALGRRGRALMPLVLVAAALVVVAAPLEGFIAPLHLPWPADLAIATMWVGLLGAFAQRALASEAPRLAGETAPTGPMKDLDA